MQLYMTLPSPVLFVLKCTVCNDGGFHPVWSARNWPGPYTISADLSRLGLALTSKEDAEALQFHALSSSQGNIETDGNE